MKINDFAEARYSKTGKRRVLAYYVVNHKKLRQYFKDCHYKPVILAAKLGLHYQSLKKILTDTGLWFLVKTKNGRGAGFNTRFKPRKNIHGYMYSEDYNNVYISNGKSRRKLKHIEVMENYLGRAIERGEVVHHIDCDKINNKTSNLYLCSRSKHTALHHQLEMLAAQLVKSGSIGFDKKSGRYYKKRHR